MALILSLTMFAKNMNGLLPRIGDFSLTSYNRLVLIPLYLYGDDKTC